MSRGSTFTSTFSVADPDLEVKVVVVVAFTPVEEVERILVVPREKAEREVRDFSREEWVEEPMKMSREDLVVVVVRMDWEVVVEAVVVQVAVQGVVQAVVQVEEEVVGELEMLEVLEVLVAALQEPLVVLVLSVEGRPVEVTVALDSALK